MGVGFAFGFVSSVVSDLILGEKIDLKQALVSGAFGAASGLLANIGISFTCFIISNALLSAGESVINDVFFENNTDALDIFVNAFTSGVINALFTIALGNPNSKKTSELYQNARDASKRLKAKGLHPNVKAKYNNAILIYKKQLKKICATSISESLYISPIEELFVKLYQLVL